MPYEIFLHELAENELGKLRSFDRVAILEAIERQLRDQPTVATRRRKCLIDLTPNFPHAVPIWELRVAKFRVFYDVDEELRHVNVRAVRLKKPEQRTKDITS